MSSLGLSLDERKHARQLAVNAAKLLFHHAPAVHYTMAAAPRWEGMTQKKLAWKGEFPTHADCSSAVTWFMWQVGHHFGLPDFANSENWNGGFTGTLAQHGKRVTDGKYLLGDVALYGPGPNHTHTALIVSVNGNGEPKVISHGSEGGPFLLDLHYRNDLAQVRRLIR
jgi:hypothetical protein